MNKKAVILLLPILLFLIPILVFSASIQQTVYFNQNDMKFHKVNGNDMIGIRSCINIKIPGNPILPAMPAKVLLPQGAVVRNVKIVNINSTDIGKNYLIQPAGKPQIISYPKYEKIEPNKRIYESKDFYPGSIVQYSGQGFKDGYNIANILIYPLQYAGLSGRLRFVNSVTFEIDYNIDSRKIKQEREYVIENVSNIISNMITNPEDVNQYKPIQRTIFDSRALDPDTIAYVIITASTFETDMQPLVNWKTKKGVPAKIVTLDYIYANYSGNDNSDRIRNFIIDAHNTWGTMYFVLGGQCDFENGEEIVPRRDAYYKTSGAGHYLDEDTIITDLYYGDLDGDWNANANLVYGEVSDNVDMYTDVHIGRAPFKNATQAQTFVNKTLTYEKNIPTGYVNSTVLPAVELFTYYNFWGDTVNNALADITPSPWTDNKLYESSGSLSQTAVRNAMNNGTGYVHHACHGNETGMYYASGGTVTSLTDIDGLTNGDKLGIYYSIGCFNGAMDERSGGDHDCFSEHIMNNSNGAGVISMYNSRYGLGDPPDLGPSELLDTLYLSGLFDNNCKTHGEAIAYAKDNLVPIAISEGASGWTRWCIYELNTLGDPEIHPFTSEVSNLSATYPSTVFLGTNPIDVHVQDASSSSSIEGSRVCIMMGTSIYATGLTNGSGDITLNPNISSAGDLDITITARNYYPIEDTIEAIVASGPFITYLSSTIDDALGNNNGQINPGETIDLSVYLKNVGVAGAHSVYALLSTTDPDVTVNTDSSNYGDISAGDSALSITDYNFTVGTVGNNHSIPFILNITSSESTWTGNFSLITHAPVISQETFAIDDATTGNNDGKWGTNEQVKLIFGVKNSGGEIAKNVNINITTSTSGITIDDGNAVFGDIDTSATVTNTMDDLLATSTSIPTGTEITIDYTISGDNFADVTGTVNITVGQKSYIIFDLDGNLNSGTVMQSTLNTLGYSGDYYTSFSPMIDSLNNYSSVFVFAGIYSNNQRIYPDTGVKFANYCQNDGGKLYIEGGDVLGFDPTNWFNPGYDFKPLFGISYISDGSGDLATVGGVATTFTAGMSFSYSGDNSYIDRIAPTGSGAFAIFNNSSPVYGCGVAKDGGTYKTVGLSFEFGGLTDGSGVSTKDTLALNIMEFFGIHLQGVAIDRFSALKKDRTLSFGIKAKGSNLFSNKLDLEYGIVHSGKVEIEIYNTTGRKIKILVNATKNAGYHRVSWDGKDDNGRNIVNGIYFIMIKSSGKIKNTKVMLIK
ncbi:hypothetical protein DRP43_00880 [candidate division TA06 bacterium]|uniref:Gingipain R n=1 Tax=candidate division TA06 bacterium TaxID=2250710 RepID=A0A660SR38_UNCT6|nr:MAG: hypothetical protein DRP43_00880 [candidate division TA06 bacterium]